MTVRLCIRVAICLTSCLWMACGGVSRTRDMGSIDWGRAGGGRGEDRVLDAWARGRGGVLWRHMQHCLIVSGWCGPIDFRDWGDDPWNCWAESDPRFKLLAAKLGDEALDPEALFGGALHAAVLGRFDPTPTSRLAIRWAERAAPSVTNGEVYLTRLRKTSRTQTLAGEPTQWPVGAVGPAEGLVVVLLLLELGDGRQAARWLRGAPNTPVVLLLRAQAASLDSAGPASARHDRLVHAWQGVRMLMPARAQFELAHLALAAGALDEAAAHLAILTAEAEPAPPVRLPSIVLAYPPSRSARPRKESPAVKDLASRIEAARRSVPGVSDPPAPPPAPAPAPAPERLPDPAELDGRARL